VKTMTDSEDKVEIPTAEQQAHQWMVLLTSERARDADRSRFQRWLAIDSEHQQAWQETETIWQESQKLTSLGNTHAPKTGLPHNNRWSFARFTSGLALAASVVLAVALWLPNQDETHQGVSYHSELAQSRDIHLPEGSVVTLGADSRIELHLTEQERRITLVHGEAFFDVAKDRQRPFVVTSGNTQVSVLGTRFNLNTFNDRTKVNVQSGLVAVKNLTSNQQVELAPGERVVSHKAQLSPVSRVDAQKSGAWRNGLRVYFDTSLNDVVADFNRYSKRPLELSSDELGDLSLTAVFPTDDIDNMILSLSDVLPIIITEQQERILLSPTGSTSQ
tara:strand:- start:18048 stop:19043 length:996 start_codon:yes stop_codon:yes gene_type:complete